MIVVPVRTPELEIEAIERRLPGRVAEHCQGILADQGIAHLSGDVGDGIVKRSLQQGVVRVPTLRVRPAAVVLRG